MHVDARFTGDLIQIAKVAQSQDASEVWYPSLLYCTMNLYQKLSLSGCRSVIDAAVEGRSPASTLIADPAIFCTLFSLKFWYLFFDLGAACLLWRMFRHNHRQVRLVLGFWLFNPIILYDAYLHGQFDVIPIFFTVLALFLARQERPTWAVFSIGIAACYKNYAFLFLLPAILILSRRWRKRTVLFLVGTVPYLVLLLPYRTQSSLNMSGYGDWFFKVGYDVGFGGQVYIFLAFYAALLWYLFHQKAHTFEDLWRACFAILLVYYQFSYFDLHYWVWIVPFATIYFAERPREATPFYLVILACLLVLQSPAPLGRFLAPISPRFFLRLPSLMEALNPYLPMSFLLNVVRSLLAGTCFYLAYRLLRDMPASRRNAVQAAPSPATTV
jgi:Glycosyltransferase family 87